MYKLLLFFFLFLFFFFVMFILDNGVSAYDLFKLVFQAVAVNMLQYSKFGLTRVVWDNFSSLEGSICFALFRFALDPLIMARTVATLSQKSNPDTLL